MTLPIEPLTLTDADAWRSWLDAHEESSDGVWLVLAKKGIEHPTSLRYDQALDEALCSGWIDGQRRSRDDTTFVQRFTPRRRASLWSQRNIGIVARLTDDGRMRASGQAEIDRAKADGRWDRAYAGPATMEAPADLLAALEASAPASAAYAALSRSAKFSVIHPIVTAPNDQVRARRLVKKVRELAQENSPEN